MADLGRAYVTIIPKAEGITNQIANLIDPGVDRAGRSAGTALSRTLGNGIISAGTTFTNFAASGAAAIAGIAGSLSARTFGGGFARAMQIDDARAKMNQLGMETEKIMDNVNTSVTGTRYGLNEMAGIAVNFASAGVKAGGGMTNALKSVASAASIAGIDLNHMGSIYTKVASAGKVTGQVMTQLSYNGINATAALAKHFNKTEEEITKMVSSGKINFKEFSDAMYEYFGDAAKSANSTFSGALANVGAAMNRLGAKFADPLQKKLRDIFAGTDLETKGGLMLAFDNIASALDAHVIPVFEEFVDLVGGKVVNALDQFNNAMANGGSVLDGFKAAITELVPESLVEAFKNLDPQLQSIVGWLGKGVGIVTGVAAGMGVLSGAVGSLIPGVGGLVGGLMGSGSAFKLVQSAGQLLFGTLGSLLGGTGFGGAPGIIGKIFSPLGMVAAVFGTAMVKSEDFRNAIMQLVLTIGDALKPAIDMFVLALPAIADAIGKIGDFLAPIIEALSPFIGKLVEILAIVVPIVAIANKFVAIGTSIGTLISSLAPVFSFLISPVGAVIAAIGLLVAAGVALYKNWDAVKQWAQNLWEGLKLIWQGIKDDVSSMFNGIKDTIAGIWDSIKSKTSEVWNAIKSAVSSVINGIKNTVSSVVNGIKNTITSVWNAIKSVTTSVWNAVKNAIQHPIETAKNLVRNAINAIKGILSGSLPFPKIKLPHFSISGHFSLSPPSIPHFSVKWYKEGGMIMNKPTLFGGGEAGSEAILPLDPFWARMDKIADAVKENSRTVDNDITINVYAQPNMDVRQLAAEVEQRLTRLQKQRQTAYA